MGKQIKKASQKRQKVSKFQRICERCGNEVFSPKRVFRCRYCGWMNGRSAKIDWSKSDE